MPDGILYTWEVDQIRKTEIFKLKFDALPIYYYK